MNLTERLVAVSSQNPWERSEQIRRMITATSSGSTGGYNP